MVILIWLANLLISFWNIHSLGNSWVETRHEHGKAAFLAVLAAGLTGICLTWNMLVMEARFAATFGVVDPTFPQVVDGIAVWVLAVNAITALVLSRSASWAHEYRSSLLSASDDTQMVSYIAMRNSYHAVNSLGEAIKGAVDLVFSDDDSLKSALIVLAIGLTLLAGFLLVAVGIWYYAGRGEEDIESE